MPAQHESLHDCDHAVERDPEDARDVGERAVSLREAGEPAERVLYDTEIGRLVKEIQQLKVASKKLEDDMAEIRDAE